MRGGGGGEESIIRELHFHFLLNYKNKIKLTKFFFLHWGFCFLLLPPPGGAKKKSRCIVYYSVCIIIIMQSIILRKFSGIVLFVTVSMWSVLLLLFVVLYQSLQLLALNAPFFSFCRCADLPICEQLCWSSIARKFCSYRLYGMKKSCSDKFLVCCSGGSRRRRRRRFANRWTTVMMINSTPICRLYWMRKSCSDKSFFDCSWRRRSRRRSANLWITVLLINSTQNLLLQ